jgi:hypothetical protein
MPPSRADRYETKLPAGDPTFQDWNVRSEKLILFRDELSQKNLNFDLERIFALFYPTEADDFEQSVRRR